jgi:DME family drug/metabolite transporter
MRVPWLILPTLVFVPRVERIGFLMSSLLAARVSNRFAGQGGILIILLAAILWGTVGVTTRGIFTLSATTALTVAFLRLALAWPVLAGSLAAVLGRRGFTAQPRQLLLMAAIGIMLATYQLCYFGAIQRVGVAVATLVTLCAAPVIVAVISTVFLGERPTRRLAFAASLAICGTMLLISPAEGAVQGDETVFGLVLALGSAAGYALVAIVSRAIAREAHPLTSMTVGFGVGALALLPALLLEGAHFSFSPEAWALLLYLGIVPSALAYVLFTIGMRTTVATVASLVTLIEPLTAAALAWLLFDEQLGPLALVGAVLLLGAVFLLTREPR